MATTAALPLAVDPEQLYLNAMRNTSNWNSAFVHNRTSRTPYVDMASGIIQRNCNLWRDKHERILEGDNIRYPARIWRKRRAPPGHKPLPVKITDLPAEEAELYLNVVEKLETSEPWYEVDEDEFPEEDDDEDYAEPSGYRRRMRRRGPTGQTQSPRGTRGRRSNPPQFLQIEADTRPFTCPKPQCAGTFRTKAGLGQHLSRMHGEGPNSTPKTEPSEDSTPAPAPTPTTILKKPRSADASVELESLLSDTPPPSKKAPGGSRNCDTCSGDASLNKRTSRPEEMIRCCDCGRASHPSCLQFTDTMIRAVKTYKWQCIECKCCAVCKKSENDEEMLFCDDCDRGYHMYCLTPPISEPPEGSWSCDICQKSPPT